jgi:hypothetical protein
MRLKQTLLGIVGLLAIGGTSACGAVSNAKAANSGQAAGVSVEVSPNPVSAGSRIAVRATCSDKSTSATVTSPAFGTITVVQSNTSSTLLIGQTVVASTVQPGTFNVTVTCLGGGSATSRLTVVKSASGQPTVGPHTGGGFLGGGGDDANPALPWLAASAAALAIAATLAAVSVRRRRRTVALPSALMETTSAHDMPNDSLTVEGTRTEMTADGVPTELDGEALDIVSFDSAPARVANDR